MNLLVCALRRSSGSLGTQDRTRSRPVALKSAEQRRLRFSFFKDKLSGSPLERIAVVADRRAAVRLKRSGRRA